MSVLDDVEKIRSFDPDNMYNRILKGTYNLADMIVVPHASDSILRLYYWMWEEKRIN